MKITYYMPTDKEQQDALQETVRQLFQVEPIIALRATDVIIDFATLDSLADLLHAQAIQTLHVVFTLDQPGAFSPEQQVLVGRSGVEVKREYSAEEVLYEHVLERE